jgi:cell division protein FtsW
VLGVLVVVSLYGMIAYAGLRTARRAATRYTKLLASGLTSLILCQGILNIFVVLGIAPLTGVPLPFISYAPTNLLVMLASIGILLGIARPAARELRLVDREEQRRTWAVTDDGTSDPGRDRRHRGTRGTSAGRSRRAAG